MAAPSPPPGPQAGCTHPDEYRRRQRRHDRDGRESDFESYLDQVRSAEKQVALSFCHRNLNRMTLADLRHHAVNAGFEVMSVVPWIQKGHLQRLSDEAYADCRALYPTVEVTDLASPSVWVVLRKP